KVYHAIWTQLYKLDSDYLEETLIKCIKQEIKQKYSKSTWYEVYDYLECYCRLIKLQSADYYTKLCKALNIILENHNSAYHIIEGKVAPISTEQEISEISEACKSGQKAIDTHMRKALEIFSQKDKKDYANTIKEAISAVEAAVNLINKTAGKTLGDALKELDKKKTIHPALSDALQKIYGYTSDKHSGVRHAIFDGAKNIPDFADAKFMLVACSAFINYLMQRNA
ncbi:MAG: hypothetical protein WCT23_10455, partial [Candidatus Neomarinimicrobiota bacterium]